MFLLMETQPPCTDRQQLWGERLQAAEQSLRLRRNTQRLCQCFHDVEQILSNKLHYGTAAVSALKAAPAHILWLHLWNSAAHRCGASSVFAAAVRRCWVLGPALQTLFKTTVYRYLTVLHRLRFTRSSVRRNAVDFTFRVHLTFSVFPP